MSSGGETSDGGAQAAKNDALYEDREPKKIIRVITVTAYMVSVSFVGVVLSAYYIFLWHPPNPAEMHRQAGMTAHLEARQQDLPVELTTLVQGNALPMRAARLPDHNMDVFEAQRHEPTAETLKIRREILKNVNAILRANFERTTVADASGDDRPMDLLPLNDGIVASNDIQSTEGTTAEDSGGSSSTPMVLPTLIARMRRTTLKSMNSKRQHQVPFPLKHLEVPIKSDAPRKRPNRPTASPADSRG